MTFERHPPNDKYENFLTVYIEAVAKYIPSEPRGKCTVHWDSIVVKDKKDEKYGKKHHDLIKETKKNTREN